MYKQILVPVDGSDTSNLALKEAIFVMLSMNRQNVGRPILSSSGPMDDADLITYCLAM